MGTMAKHNLCRTISVNLHFIFYFFMCQNESAVPVWQPCSKLNRHFGLGGIKFCNVQILTFNEDRLHTTNIVPPPSISKSLFLLPLQDRRCSQNQLQGEFFFFLSTLCSHQAWKFARSLANTPPTLKRFCKWKL